MSRQRLDTTTARRSPMWEVVAEVVEAAVPAGPQPCICTSSTPDMNYCHSAGPIRRREPSCWRWSRDGGGWTVGHQAEVVPRCVSTRLGRLDRRRRTNCSCPATSRCRCASVDRRSCQSSCIYRCNQNRKQGSCRRWAAPAAGSRPRLSQQLI